MANKNVKKKSSNISGDYVNKFTGEKLSTYPIMAALLSKEISNRTSNEEKLQKQIEKFKGKYKCPFCGQDRRWIPGTNVMVCVNESCKGFKAKDKKKEGEEIVYPSFKILSTRGEAIADSLMG